MIEQDQLWALLSARRGHFMLESGYHSDVWWDLEALCHQPKMLMPFVTALAAEVRKHQPDIVCGALVEGAFVALLVATELSCHFAYALRLAGRDGKKKLFPISYQVPAALHSVVRGKRVVIVNDVISAGSAVRGAMEHVQELGGTVVAVASLVLLSESFAEFCKAKKIPFRALYRQEQQMWPPDACPLCLAGSTPECLADH